MGCANNIDTLPQKYSGVDAKQTLQISDDDGNDSEVYKYIGNLSSGVAGGDVDMYMEAIQQLQKILAGNQIKCDNPIKHFTDIMSFLSGTDAMGIDAWKKREIADIAGKMIHRVYLKNKQQGIPVAQSVKDGWLDQIKQVENLINNKLIRQNGLEFEIDCMRAGINVLSIGQNDIKDKVMGIVQQMITASINAVKGDYSGLISLGKDMLGMLITYGGNKMNEFWYLKVMAMSYTHGLSAINQEMLGQVVQILTESKNGDWHVCYAGLHAISKAIDTDIQIDSGKLECKKLDLTEAVKMVEQFSLQETSLCGWRLREKVAQICIEQAGNKTYGDKLTKVLLDLQIKEKNSDVKKTLQNPDYIKSVKARLQKEWKAKETDEEAAARKQQEQLDRIEALVKQAAQNNDQASVQLYKQQYEEEAKAQKQAMESFQALSKTLDVQIGFVDDINKQLEKQAAMLGNISDTLKNVETALLGRDDSVILQTVIGNICQNVDSWADEITQYTPLSCVDKMDLLEATIQFINSDKLTMLIQGAEQSGKSTFCKFLSQKMLEMNKIPVYVDVESCSNKMKIIEGALSDLRLSAAEIDKFKDAAEFVLIIDGYEKTKTFKNLYATNNMQKWKCKVIFTSQSEFIATNTSYAKCFTYKNENSFVDVTIAKNE
ncbi:Pentapeptide_repeats-containing protein [Hexamita inflata]|uniref:Pentapeptide repeats-containing protein n=1 Tax=Hexamita inflata TaxID=28002 RepID=A0AA86NNY2_9EUKA|nr:Pentapeptide repeats-containing protein [Hexamita inflata]